MMTITLNDGNGQIKIPQSWNEIHLGDYEKWFGAEPETKLEQINYIAGICGIDPGILLESPSQVFEIITKSVSFVFEDYTGESSNSIKIGNKIFQISFSDDLTLAEWVDIESVFETESTSRLSEILSILCRPVGEAYDSKFCEQRKKMFAELTMDRVLPLLAFFLLRGEQSEMISSLYSRVRQHAALYLELTRSFAENGDGIKLLPIWQRIKYFFLTRFLRKRLSKFLDSSSIG